MTGDGRRYVVRHTGVRAPLPEAQPERVGTLLDAMPAKESRKRGERREDHHEGSETPALHRHQAGGPRPGRREPGPRAGRCARGKTSSGGEAQSKEPAQGPSRPRVRQGPHANAWRVRTANSSASFGEGQALDSRSEVSTEGTSEYGRRRGRIGFVRGGRKEGSDILLVSYVLFTLGTGVDHAVPRTGFRIRRRQRSSCEDPGH